MIFTDGLTYQYQGQQPLTFQNLALTAGQPWLLLGQSGSGKTTLLHLLGGLLRVTAGSIRIGDTTLTGLGEGELDRFRGQHIGFVFQKNHLINALTVRENLLMAPFLAGLPQDEGRVKEVLDQLGILDKANSAVTKLSHGQAQRVAIARALLNRPSIILADEPTSALDDHHCGRVIELLLEASHRNKSTLVVATHDQRLRALIHNQILLDR